MKNQSNVKEVKKQIEELIESNKNASQSTKEKRERVNKVSFSYLKALLENDSEVINLVHGITKVGEELHGVRNLKTRTETVFNFLQKQDNIFFKKEYFKVQDILKAEKPLFTISTVSGDIDKRKGMTELELIQYVLDTEQSTITAEQVLEQGEDIAAIYLKKAKKLLQPTEESEVTVESVLSQFRILIQNDEKGAYNLLDMLNEEMLQKMAA